MCETCGYFESISLDRRDWSLLKLAWPLEWSLYLDDQTIINMESWESFYYPCRITHVWRVDIVSRVGFYKFFSSIQFDRKY